MSACAHAKIRGQVINVMVDSGAGYNFMSVKLANQLGIKHLTRVQCPPIVLPDGSHLKQMGMVKVGVRFTRHLGEVSS